MNDDSVAHPADQPAITRALRRHRMLSLARYAWSAHGWALLVYLALTIVLTWPLLPNFATKITGAGDARTLLWMLWHVREAMLGHESLFGTSLLYYPHGTTLLTSTFIPLPGLMALPFWALGPEAAYNGALLLGFWLTGYCGYLLARSLNFSRSIAFFAGTVLLVAPIHLTALAGHMHKIFLGSLPLTLLAFNHALDVKRSAKWTVATSGALLMTMLQGSDLFVFACLSIAFFAVFAWLEAARTDRRKIIQRLLMVGATTLVLVGPLVVAILIAANNPASYLDVSQESFQHQPDLVKFFVPMEYGLGRFFAPQLYPHVRGGIETAVFLGWTNLVLLVFAMVSRQSAARRWIWFVVFCVIIALGPTLMIFGERYFTNYKLPIILPYAVLNSLPGFSFWRTPGRMMLAGFMGLGVAASFGLAWLGQRLPKRWGTLLPIVSTILVLLENMPGSPPPQTPLPVVPPFYQQLAHDPDQYGVFDLPIRPYPALNIESDYIPYSARYEIYQMTHHKGIASGYISRYYNYHPVFAQLISRSPDDLPWESDVMLNGQPTNRFADAQYELARNNYRYVVFHKPQPGDSLYKPDSWGEQASKEFIESVFNNQTPVVDDDFTTVYQVSPITDITSLAPTIALRESLDTVSYQLTRGGRRWALSPATFYTASPYSTTAYLEVLSNRIEDTESNAPAHEGRIFLQTPNGQTTFGRIVPGQTVTLPLTLSAGSEIITLTVRPTSTQSVDTKMLNFEIGVINLRTTGRETFPSDLLIEGRRQSDIRAEVQAIYGEGWYTIESEGSGTWRWAESPATVWVYSASPRQVSLALTPVFLNEPASPNRLGNQGVMTIRANDDASQRIDVQVDQPTRFSVNLIPGWNRLVFELAAGNFQPRQVGLADTRHLSFAIDSLDIRSVQK